MTINSPKILPRAIIAAILAITVCLVVQAQQSSSTDEKAEETKTGAITGTVVNDTGQPLVGAAVFVSAVSSPALGRTTTTDSEGNFQVKGLDPALYSVGARIPAYVSPPRDPDDPQQANYYYRVGDSVRVVLIKGAVITGTVTNSSGEPVVKVSVRVFMVRDANGQPPKAISQFGERETDDRGVYRIYGLMPGTYVVSAGGGNRLGYAFAVNAFDGDAPTYAPASTRDTAAEITVRAGDETSSVDIRYRGEPGRVISGTASGPTAAGTYPYYSITLTSVSNGAPQWVSSSFQAAGARGFSFSGVVDGDYELTAQSSLAGGEIAATSEPHRVKVRGADVTGIELTTKQLASIAGRVTLEPSKAPECKGKRRPSFAETVITVTRNEKLGPLEFLRYFAMPGAPDKEGAFLLRSVQPGQYIFNPRFFAKYWYLQSISLPPAAAPAARGATANQPIDAAKNWTTVKPGDRVAGLNVTLAEGAASLRGQLTTAEGQKLPPKLVIYLAPAERDRADDVLRFFVTPVTSDGTFAIGNLPPGRYWLLARPASENPSVMNSKLRLPDESTTRSKLRPESEAAKTELELKPCQNVTDYKLPLKLSTAVVRDPAAAP